MKLTIEIDMGGFEDPSEEAGRILERYAEQLRMGGGLPPSKVRDYLFDINDIHCGNAWTDEEKSCLAHRGGAK